MIYNATLVSEAGRGVITGLKLLHHLQKVLKAYLYCFAVLSALDVMQYRGSSYASSSRRRSMPIHLPTLNIHVSEKNVFVQTKHQYLFTFKLQHFWCIRTFISATYPLMYQDHYTSAILQPFVFATYKLLPLLIRCTRTHVIYIHYKLVASNLTSSIPEPKYIESNKQFLF